MTLLATVATATTTDTTRIEANTELQLMLDRIAALQLRFGQGRLEYWALNIAWEAIRTAQYIIRSQSLEKIPQLREAIKAAEHFKAIMPE
jgi:hypothetical protein